MTALMAGVRKSSSKILAPEAETASKATAATDNISLESFVCESSQVMVERKLEVWKYQKFRLKFLKIYVLRNEVQPAVLKQNTTRQKYNKSMPLKCRVTFQ